MDIIKGLRKINRYIRGSKKVFIMAHKDLDLDALGSSVGMYQILKKIKKDCYLIIEDKKHELGVEKVIKELEGYLTIIKTSEVQNRMDPKNKKNLLLILDTNKASRTQSPEAVTYFNRKCVIDHHELSDDTIKNALLLVNPEASSTCEIITKLIELYDIEMESYYSTVLLAGIVVDTNNFTLKTDKDTYYAAYFLANMGASAKKVQYLLKQNLDEYTERQKMFSNVEIIDENIAVTKATSTAMYRKEDLAKTADTLLFFNNIEASFVIGKLDNNTVGISARSLGNIDVRKIMEKLGGGGGIQNSAATLENTTITKALEKLKKALKEEE